jgi:hypothetical protein
MCCYKVIKDHGLVVAEVIDDVIVAEVEVVSLDGRGPTRTRGQEAFPRLPQM